MILAVIIIILLILWVLGYTPITVGYIPNPVLLSINNHSVTLWELLILLAVAWAISILPKPFQVIFSILLILWILSVLNIFAFFVGLPSILVLIIIVFAAISLLL